MMIDFFQPGTSRGMFWQMMASRNTVPPRMFLIVPFGDFHICFRLNSARVRGEGRGLEGRGGEGRGGEGRGGEGKGGDGGE